MIGKNISTVFNEDCMSVMARFPDKHFDLAIVDPPYGVGIAKWDKEIPSNEYFTELFRVSKNQIIWGGNFFNLPPTKCYIVWNKRQDKFLKVRSSLEYAWTSFDGLPYYLEYIYCGNAEGLEKIRVDYTKKSIHPCQKPVNVYQIIIEQFGMDANIILDTHLGSGSIRIAANKLNKEFVGCEIDAEYFEAQEARFKDFTAQLRLFG